MRRLTFAGCFLFAGLVGFAVGNGKTTQDALQGTRHALVRQCDVQVTKAVGKAVTNERRKRVIFLPF